MIIIHERYRNVPLADEFEFLGALEWTDQDWEEKLNEKGCRLVDGEIELDVEDNGEFVEVWRKVSK
jgi:hypothetical protein